MQQAKDDNFERLGDDLWMQYPEAVHAEQLLWVAMVTTLEGVQVSPSLGLYYPSTLTHSPDPRPDPRTSPRPRACPSRSHWP